MGAVKLELSCPPSVHGIGAVPDPDWTFDALLAELNSLEKKINSSSAAPIHFTKTKSRDISVERGDARKSSGFVMRISDDEMEDLDEEAYGQSLEMRRFAFDDLYLSDSDSDDLRDEFALEEQFPLMEKARVAEGALLELTREHQHETKEEIRNRISSLETDLMRVYEKSSSAFVRIEKYRDARRELDRKLDTQYQRKIAEALDSHLTTIQRNHELKSQIEERKIRSDAAFEEARRKEKALQEEKRRQEKAIAEAEEKRKAEEAKTAASEAERKAKEAAEKEAANKEVASEMAKREAEKSQVDFASANITAHSKKVKPAGSILKAAGNSLKLEQGRLDKIRELEETNQALKYQQDFSNYDSQISRIIRQISGTEDSVRSKSSELIKLLNDPCCPPSVSIAILASKIVSMSECTITAAFARGHVFARVISQVPHAMDIILAEFHRACIYTVPKHISYSKSAFESVVDYHKAIGYREVDGKIESENDYMNRLQGCMKLYGAIVQTEFQGVQNMHGLEEGWAWLARFLNNLPANTFTAHALYSFLQMAGFALHRRFKNQFQKILKIIGHDFLNVLKAQDDQATGNVVTNIESYIKDKVYLQEPEGWRLKTNLLSNTHHEQYSQSSTRYYY